MRIGPYRIFSIETSRFALDGGAMFGIIPKSIWETYLPADEKNRVSLTTRSLFLRSDDRNIIVDSGNGTKWNDKYRSIFKIDTETVNIPMSLKRHQLDVEDITDVICTHLHFDHAGGNTRYNSAGRLVPTFPRATYWINRENWTLANSPSVKDRASYRSENWSVLAENGMIELVDGEEDFIPDIEIFLTKGHTAGHQLPKVSDGHNRLIFGGDLIPTIHHLQIPWVMAYDNYPLQTIAEKLEILTRIVDEDWILFLAHDLSHEAIEVMYERETYRVKNPVNIGCGECR